MNDGLYATDEIVGCHEHLVFAERPSSPTRAASDVRIANGRRPPAFGAAPLLNEAARAAKGVGESFGDDWPGRGMGQAYRVGGA